MLVQGSKQVYQTAEIRRTLFVLVGIGVLFQIGHFVEHAVQFGVWLFGLRTSAYMSPIAMGLSHLIGNFFVGQDPMPRQMMVGMEILHLIGNGLFLLTIIGLLQFFSVKAIRWALYVEAFHLCEHAMLTYSAIAWNQQIGMSTLFGFSSGYGQEFAVGYRVIWHFAMNLIPSLLVMRVLLRSKSR